MKDPKTPTLRAQSTILTGLAGGATAQAMSLWGAETARFLPSIWFLTIAAFIGAAVAGAIMVGAFGRHGKAGVLLAAVAWPVTTVLGASVASIPFGLVDVGLRSNAVFATVQALETAAPLGVFAVTSGITGSFHVAGIWIISAAVLHVTLRAARQSPT